MKNLYFQRSKNLANSFVFILPLLVLYELGIALQSSNIKNTADIIIKTPLSLFGKNGSFIFNLLVIIFLLISIFYLEKERSFQIFIFFPMFIESLVYALCIGYILGFLVYKILFPYVLAAPLAMHAWTSVLLSVGAGVYEEIVFRLLLISALYYICIHVLKTSRPFSAMISIALGALIFASMHYIGDTGNKFTYMNFTFRLLSGIILSTIFMFRGLGIAVYTHTIYDVFVVLKPLVG